MQSWFSSKLKATWIHDVKIGAAIAWYLGPFIYSLVMAASLYAQTTPSEENRRIIEREMERQKAIEQIHDKDVKQLQRDLHAQNEAIQARLDTIERYVFYLFLGSGGTIGVVGIDKATYWVKKQKS